MKKLITSGIISFAMASTLMAQEGDIVFVVDESGSMGPKIQAVIDNVESIVDALSVANIDYQLGLVGFGANTDGNTNPRVVTKLDSNATVFKNGLQSLTANSGSYEPGFAAVELGMSSSMEPESFRPDAGTCLIMLTDEEAGDLLNKTAALTALSNRNAIFYGIVNISGRTLGPRGPIAQGTTSSDYGLDTGLSAETGGSVWDIADLDDPLLGQGIIQEVMDKCINEAIAPVVEVNFDVHPTSCPNPINLKSRGLTPMAILGTAEFDVNDVNVSSLTINGASPEKYAYEDVSSPYTDLFSEDLSKDECTKAGEDGYEDLTLKFNTQDLLLESGVQHLVIEGQTLDGTPIIIGNDVIWAK